MEDTRRRAGRIERHATHLARYAIREAGTPTNVGRAMRPPRAPSTIAHYSSDRVHPQLRDAFLVLLTLTQHPNVDADAFLQACEDAVEFGSMVMAETDDLVREGIRLLDLENQHGAEEDRASMRGTDHDVWLLRVARTSTQLARIIRELRLRGVDLHRVYRERVA